MTSVSVVIPYYNQPTQLLRVWEGLRRQLLPDVQVVVADDGSAQPPPRLPGVVYVRQEDRGFRAAAARNLGASVAEGEVIAFLDADTIPEPAYLAALVPAAVEDVIAVGRRRHAELSGWSPGQTGAWLDGGRVPRELMEPAWLRDGYRETDNLRHADGRSFRFIISAVMALRRDLFAALRGFDERYVGYGGEDWDLAYRAWNTGCNFRHVPRAVAWHDGPEWAQRPHASKTAEQRRLAQLIPEPSVRKGAPSAAVADVLVDVPPGTSPALLRLLREQSYADLLVGEAGAWSADLLDRARFRIVLDRPVPLDPQAVAIVVETLSRAPAHPLKLVDRCGHHLGTAAATRGRRQRDPAWRAHLVETSQPAQQRRP